MRFTGCNLWSGREVDRHKATCKFCDTDFVGTNGHLGGKYTADDLTDLILSLWHRDEPPYIVFTGGEPLLQLDNALIQSCHAREILVGVETNGTIIPPKGIDWLCMSPKANTDIVVQSGDEIKIIFPQFGVNPQDFLSYNFNHFFVQPMFGKFTEENMDKCQQYIHTYPQWKLSIQTHKILGIP